MNLKKPRRWSRPILELSKKGRKRKDEAQYASINDEGSSLISNIDPSKMVPLAPLDDEGGKIVQETTNPNDVKVEKSISYEEKAGLSLIERVRYAAGMSGAKGANSENLEETVLFERYADSNTDIDSVATGKNEGEEDGEVETEEEEDGEEETEADSHTDCTGSTSSDSLFRELDLVASFKNIYESLSSQLSSEKGDKEVAQESSESSEWFAHGQDALKVSVAENQLEVEDFDEISIWTACKVGKEDVVQQSLEDDPEVIHEHRNGRSPLYHACHCGHGSIVRMLLAAGARDTDGTCYKAALNDECRGLLKDARKNDNEEAQNKDEEERGGSMKDAVPSNEARSSATGHPKKGLSLISAILPKKAMAAEGEAGKPKKSRLAAMIGFRPRKKADGGNDAAKRDVPICVELASGTEEATGTQHEAAKHRAPSRLSKIAPFLPRKKADAGNDAEKPDASMSRAYPSGEGEALDIQHKPDKHRLPSRLAKIAGVTGLRFGRRKGQKKDIEEPVEEPIEEPVEEAIEVTVGELKESKLRSTIVSPTASKDNGDIEVTVSQGASTIQTSNVSILQPSTVNSSIMPKARSTDNSGPPSTVSRGSLATSIFGDDHPRTHSNPLKSRRSGGFWRENSLAYTAGGRYSNDKENKEDRDANNPTIEIDNLEYVGSESSENRKHTFWNKALVSNLDPESHVAFEGSGTTASLSTSEGESGLTTDFSYSTTDNPDLDIQQTFSDVVQSEDGSVVRDLKAEFNYICCAR